MLVYADFSWLDNFWEHCTVMPDNAEHEGEEGTDIRLGILIIA